MLNLILLYLSWCSQPKPDSDKYWWAFQTVIMPVTLVTILVQLGYERVFY